MNRREFLQALAAAPLLASCQAPKQATFTGHFVGPNMQLGHQLRTGDIPRFSQTKRSKVAIIGAGISGLSAGWLLQKKGITDFQLFELESTVGGNARSGQNNISAYPWGAHYLPIPNENAWQLKSFLAEAGAITANADSRKPTYHDRFLCFEPEERLYIYGVWQEGLMPKAGISKAEQAEFARFNALMSQYKHAKGKDGRAAFTIPLADSSQDPEFLALDHITIAQFLKQQSFNSPALHWYVNYACRDDYGTDYHRISAWAGIHYFASRNGQASNADEDQVLTWPQGNAWLANQLAKPLSQQIQTDALVHQISTERHHVCLDVFSHSSHSTTRWLVDQVIFASPLHVLPHVLRDTQTTLTQAAKQVPHAPWLVANISVNGWPEERNHVGLAWDNVIYNSHSLGYVSARHQELSQHIENNVITYYLPLAYLSESQARLTLKNTSWSQWAQAIVQDIEKAHPSIAEHIQNIDIFRWAHAMTYPYQGFLKSAQRAMLNQRYDRLHLAHTDAAGISIFEEAFSQGTCAAHSVLSRL